MAPPQPKTGSLLGLTKGTSSPEGSCLLDLQAEKGCESQLLKVDVLISGRLSAVSFLFLFASGNWNLIRDVAGFAPYEKRITELVKVGKDKRALKVAN
ncbi:hypothetical protein ZIOFF_050422 [Zingiber officinale]|uniref:60S ribosomal protein L36 n=1 Tax=Zingiber officinale TaxID=94328 RepID=A0A8J5FGU4_ZINOF|nr:hypothetical protein ZIOFF_050422 [Zingiber officinale]